MATLRLKTPKQFGASLRAHRKIQAQSLKTVAEKLGVSISIVSQWECGLRYPNVRNLHKLTKYTGRTFAELLYK